MSSFDANILITVCLEGYFTRLFLPVIVEKDIKSIVSICIKRTVEPYKISKITEKNLPTLHN